MIRYVIGYVNEASPPLKGHSLIIARVIENEIGGEPLTRKTVDGLIRIIADAQGFGKYVDIDQVFNDLKTVGFLGIVDIE